MKIFFAVRNLNKQHIVLTIAILVNILVINAQKTVISGTIIDQLTKEALPYAIIQMPKAGIGTNSDENGRFQLQVPNRSDSITVNLLGYKMTKFSINNGPITDMVIRLSNTNYDIGEVKVIASRDPGRDFMKKVIAHKPKNDPSRLESYSYRTYNKIELDLKNIQILEKANSKMIESMVGIINNADTANINKKILPIYFVENLKHNIHSNKSSVDYSETVAQKTLGLGTDVLVGQLDKYIIHLNPYQNWFNLFDESFAGPVGDASHRYYKYYIEDSFYIQDRKKYIIQFVPRSAYDNTFTGMMWVNDSSYSIDRIEMHMSPHANINLISAIKIENAFDLYSLGDKGEHIFMPKRYASEVTFESGLELLGIPFSNPKNTINLIIKNTSVFDNIILNDTLVKQNPKVYHTNRNLSNDFRKLDRDEEFWKKNRLENLNNREKGIYTMMDSLKQNTKFKTSIRLATLIGTGYWDFGNKVRIGPYTSMFSQNKTEGYRFKMNAWTLPGIHKSVGLHASLAYGTKDALWKGGGGIRIIHNEDRWSQSAIKYFSDYNFSELFVEELQNDNFLSSSFKKRDIDPRRIFDQGLIVSHEEQLTPAFTNKTSFSMRKYIPSFDFRYKLNPLVDTIEQTSLSTMEFHTAIEYAPFVRTKIFNYSRITLGSTKPIINLAYTLGIKSGDAQFNYQKLDFSVSHRLKLPPRSYLNYSFAAGKTFGTVPFLLLDIPRGNAFFISSKYLFNTMLPYEFMTDQYVSFIGRFTFGGLIFNHIPFINKMGIRERAHFKAYYGNISAANQKFNYASTFKTLNNTPFMECSIGLENIFHVIYIEYIKRLNYLDDTTRKFSGIYFGFDFVL